LRRYFFGEDAPYKEKCENTKVVIYSGFTKELREHIKQLPLANEERQWFKKVELVGKVSGEYKTVTNKIIGFLNDD
jgi:hypothetical protein